MKYPMYLPAFEVFPSSSIEGFLLVLNGIFFAMLVLLSCGFLYFRSKNDHSVSTTIYYIMFIVGGTCVHVGVFLIALRPQSSLCIPSWYFIGLGFEIILATIVGKQIRVFIITRKELWNSLKYFEFIFAISNTIVYVILLGVWAGVDPIRLDITTATLDEFQYMTICRPSSWGFLIAIACIMV